MTHLFKEKIKSPKHKIRRGPKNRKRDKKKTKWPLSSSYLVHGEEDSSIFRRFDIDALSWYKSFLLRACVFLRRHHTFPRQLLEWSMRSAVTYRASPEYGLISIFHSVKKMHISSRHTHNLYLEMPNVHCLSLDPCVEWVSFFGSRIGNVQC